MENINDIKTRIESYIIAEADSFPSRIVTEKEACAELREIWSDNMLMAEVDDMEYYTQLYFTRIRLIDEHLKTLYMKLKFCKKCCSITLHKVTVAKIGSKQTLCKCTICKKVTI